MVRLSVLNRHVLICSCDQCHTLSYLTDSYRWICGLVSAVDSACLCMATDSIARRRPRFALALREGPCCGYGCCPRVSGMLSFVMEHVCQIRPRTSWVDFRWGLSTTRRMERLKWSSTATQFLRKRQGPLAGPAHDSSVFDSVRLLQQLASNELDIVGGSDIGIGRHAKIHEPIFRFTVTEQATAHPCHTSHVIAFALPLFSREALPPPS